jgi:hypothetical protein
MEELVINIDMEQLGDDELVELLNHAKAERDRRYTTAVIPGQIDSLNRQYLEQTGRGLNLPWQQPTGAHDAYPEGWVVTHNGEQWVSIIPANVWEPGVSGWGVLVPEGELPKWQQPTGAHDSYAKGALVLHNERQWISDVDANVWEPGVHGWTEFDPEVEAERMIKTSRAAAQRSFADAMPIADMLSPLDPQYLGFSPNAADEGPETAMM